MGFCVLFMCSTALPWHGDELFVLFDPPFFKQTLTANDVLVKNTLSGGFISFCKEEWVILLNRIIGLRRYLIIIQISVDFFISWYSALHPCTTYRPPSSPDGSNGLGVDWPLLLDDTRNYLEITSNPRIRSNHVSPEALCWYAEWFDLYVEKVNPEGVPQPPSLAALLMCP